MRRRALAAVLLALPAACAGLDGLTGGGKDEPKVDSGLPLADSGGGQTDSGGSSGLLDGGPVDAPPPPTCDRSAPFTSVTPVSGLPVNASEPVLSADELEIFFTLPVGDAGQRDVRRATRTSPTVSFGSPNDPVGIHIADEQPFVLVAGGLTLLGTLGGRPGYVTRPAPTQPFGLVQVLDGVGSDVAFVWTNDAQSAAYGIERDFFGNTKIVGYVATPGKLSLPQDLGLSPNGARDTAVIATEDELQLFVTNKRTGSAGQDVYTTIRAGKTAAWGPLTLVSELNTSGDDSLTSVSRDGCVAYGVHVVNGGGGGGGGINVYRAEKTKK